MTDGVRKAPVEGDVPDIGTVLANMDDELAELLAIREEDRSEIRRACWTLTAFVLLWAMAYTVVYHFQGLLWGLAVSIPYIVGGIIVAVGHHRLSRIQSTRMECCTQMILLNAKILVYGKLLEGQDLSDE